MELNCPVCRRLVSLADEAFDTQVVCPYCDQMFLPSAVLANVGNPRLADCPDCGHTVSRRASSCPKCGAPLKQPTPSTRDCPDCGKQVPDNLKVCPNCGAPMSPHSIPMKSTEPPRPTPPARMEERATAGRKRNNPWALAGFILGSFSIPLSIIGILSIAAVICGLVGVSTFDEKTHKNEWMGWTGVSLGCLGFLANLAAYGYLG